MALTFTKKEEDQLGGRIKAWIYDILLDTSYPTGGYAISPSKIGLKTIWGFNILGINAAGSGIVNVAWDYVNGKLMAFRVATFTPAGTIAKPTFTITKGAILASSELGLSADATSATVNNNTIASTLTLLAANSPVGAPAFTGGAQGQVAFAEVTAAVNLSAVTVRAMVLGRP